MKKIILAKNAGFCFGVQRAMDKALECAKAYDEIFSFGELIHNADAVAMLAEQGVLVVDELEGLQDTNLIIRSHGAAPLVHERCLAQNINLIDATCPLVKKVHDMVKDSGARPVIIVGQADHPEIVGLFGWAGENTHIVGSPQEAQQLPRLERPIVVAQTTLRQEQFEGIVQVINKRVADPEIHNTICGATKARQEEAVDIAGQSDLVLVVGGKNSSNTKKLRDICAKYCENVYLIENKGDLPLEIVKSSDIIGIVAGASTPDWIIREVLTTMSEENTNQEVVEQGNGSTEENVAEQGVVTLADEFAAAAKVIEKDGNIHEAAKEMVEEVAKEAVEEGIATEQAAEAVAAAAVEEVVATEKQIVEDDDSQASFMDDLEASLKKIMTNQIVKGSVVQVNDNEIFLNIGYKSDGVIPKSEYSNDTSISLRDEVKEGDEIEVQVLKLNDGEGNVLLSKKKLQFKKVWTDFEQMLEEGKDILTVKVKEVVKGGLISEAMGLRIFIPASLVDVRFIKDMNQFIDQDIEVKIIEFDKGKKKIVGSRKVLLEEGQKKLKEELWGKFEPKQTIQGVVKRLTDFGAFIDIGGIDGLLHVADIAWFRIEHPSEVLNVNDPITVQILSINKEKERISLGLKQLQPKPWETVLEKYQEGDEITGKVVRILEFGAFVELEPGIDGLIHISQVAPKRIERVEDELSIGEEITAKVLSVEADNKKISLSRKALMQPEESDERPQPRARKRAPEEDTYIPEIQESSVTIAEFLPQDFIDELKKD